MVTRYFDEPITVHYRTTSDWRRVPALGVRRSRDEGYQVLIDLATSEQTPDTVWVPRSRIRVVDPAMAGTPSWTGRHRE